MKVNEELKRIRTIMNLPNRRRTIITESELNSKTIINVDIQPEYQKSIPFLYDWVNFLNENYEYNKIIFLYNGEDTMGMVSQNEFIMWLMDIGVSENVIDQAIFYDKGYAFFRYCIDEGIDDDEIVELVKFMIRKNVNDSREITQEMWESFINEIGYDNVREMMEYADDMIYIPELMDFISNFNNIVLTGGGINECLKEVEIALLSLEKPYTILDKYTY